MIANQTTINGSIKDAAYTANGDICINVQIPKNNVDDTAKKLIAEVDSLKKSIPRITREDGSIVTNLHIERK